MFSTCCLKYVSTCARFIFRAPRSRGVPDDLLKISWNALVWLLVGSTFSLIEFESSWRWHIAGRFGVIAMSEVCSVSTANNFVNSQSAADYGYYAFGEVAHFVYCLLQKIKQSSVLPLVGQWEEYMAPNHSKFAAIEEESSLAGTRVSSALEKVGSSYLKREFRRDCRKFLEDFTNCVLSTVAARSAKGQELSCFCPPILVDGDDHAPMRFFDMLLDGLLEKGWVRGPEMEARKSEYLWFMQEQRQLERNSTRSRPDVGNVQTFCSPQGGFRVWRHLYKVCLVSKNAVLILLQLLAHSFFVSGLSINSTCHTWTSNIWRDIYCEFGSGGYQGGSSARCPAVCSGFCERSCFHPAQLLLRDGCRNVI